MGKVVVQHNFGPLHKLVVVPVDLDGVSLVIADVHSETELLARRLVQFVSVSCLINAAAATTRFRGLIPLDRLLDQVLGILNGHLVRTEDLDDPFYGSSID